MAVSLEHRDAKLGAASEHVVLVDSLVSLTVLALLGYTRSPDDGHVDARVSLTTLYGACTASDGSRQLFGFANILEILLVEFELVCHRDMVLGGHLFVALHRVASVIVRVHVTVVVSGHSHATLNGQTAAVREPGAHHT
jgi:hypothetical protein